MLASAKRNLQIDGLRGLFCTAIMLFHFFFRYGEIFHGNEHSPLFIWLPDPKVFVAGFFCLSGFFIRYKGVSASIKDAFFKVYLPFVLCLTCTATATFCVKNLYGYSAFDFASSLLVVLPLAKVGNYLDGAHWYMSFLFMFYGIFWLVHWLSKRLKAPRLPSFVFFGLTILAFSYSFATPLTSFGKLISAALGPNYLFFAVGLFMRDFLFCENEKKGFPSSFFLVMTILKAELVFGFQYPFLNVFYYSLVVLLIFLCLKNRAPFIKLPPFVWLGRRSMYIYFLHQYIGYVIIALFEELKIQWVGTIIAIAAIIALSVLVDWLSCFLKKGVVLSREY